MWLVATIVVFLVAQQIAIRAKHPLCNPLLLSLLFLIPVLLVMNVPYTTYFEQNKWINYLLQPAVVALAYPLYEQMGLIRKHWHKIIVSCLVASLLSMVLGAGLALALGASPQVAATILPKSVSTPFAIVTAGQLGGLPSVSAALVVMAGLFGAILGYPILKYLGISCPMAKGLALGSVSHALGTAKASEMDVTEGAMSSLALVICGVFTSVLAPVVFKTIMHFYGQ